MTSNAQLRIAPSAGQFCRSVDDVGNGDVGNDDVGNENGEDGDSVDAVGKDQDNDGGQDDGDQISPKRRLFATIASKC